MSISKCTRISSSAIAVENAIAYDKIATLKDKLAQENVYLEDEIRTELNFEEPLQERPEDIPVLVRHFVQQFSRRNNRSEQPIVLRIQRDGGRLLPGKCHESNMTRPERTVQGNRVLRRRPEVAEWLKAVLLSGKLPVCLELPILSMNSGLRQRCMAPDV